MPRSQVRRTEEECLRQAALRALEQHTVECVARYLAYPPKTITRWARGDGKYGLFFKGRAADEQYRDALANLLRLAAVADCPCRRGYDFAELDQWERQAVRFSVIGS